MKTFNEEQLTEEKLMVKFGADWCGPCKMVAPVLEELSEEGYNICEVDVSDSPEVAAKYGIRGVPTYIIFEDGKEVLRDSGTKTKSEFQDMLK